MKTKTSNITDKKLHTPHSSLIVRAHECHKLMTNPRNKSNDLSETTKTWLKERAVEEVLGLRKIVTTKPMMKGILCEKESIDLYNRVMHTNHTKNWMSSKKYGFSGTPDLMDKYGIVEIKTSWDATTFPFFQDQVNKLVKKNGYDWQCRVYMMLFDCDRAVVSYCLVDTPQSTPSGDPLLNKWDDYSLHRFEGIVDPQKRVSTSEVILRDKQIEQQMLYRYKVANSYYRNYLEEIYNK